MSDNIDDSSAEQQPGRESLSSRAQRIIGRTIDPTEESSPESCMYTAIHPHIPILSLQMRNGISKNIVRLDHYAFDMEQCYFAGRSYTILME